MKAKFSLPDGRVKVRDNVSDLMMLSVPDGWKFEIVDEVVEEDMMIKKNIIPLSMRCLPSSYMASIEEPFSFYDREKPEEYETPVDKEKA